MIYNIYMYTKNTVFLDTQCPLNLISSVSPVCLAGVSWIYWVPRIWRVLSSLCSLNMLCSVSTMFPESGVFWIYGVSWIRCVLYKLCSLIYLVLETLFSLNLICSTLFKPWCVLYPLCFLNLICSVSTMFLYLSFSGYTQFFELYVFYVHYVPWMWCVLDILFLYIFILGGLYLLRSLDLSHCTLYSLNFVCSVSTVCPAIWCILYPLHPEILSSVVSAG